MSALAVRGARPEDAETIARFQESMALETEGKALDPGRIRAGVRKALAEQDEGFYLLADLDGAPAGSLLVTREWSDWRNGWFWWIQSVFVPEARRRQGVYRALHDEVRRRALAAGNVIGIRLYVERENTAAQATYERLGMRETRYLLFEEEF